MNATGQVGDFIGGVVGSLWSLVSVILFYRALTLQREDLQNQRKELRLGRLEFTVNRITNIIYKQVESFNASNFLNTQSDNNDALSFWKNHIQRFINTMENWRESIRGGTHRDLESFVDSYSDALTSRYDINLYFKKLRGVLILISNLINDREAESDNLILDETTRRQLFEVLKYNLSYEQHLSYIIAFIKFKKLHIRRIKNGVLPNVDTSHIENEITELLETKKLLESINQFTA
ncbi:MAG: hypothetical protein ACJAVP_003647 [Spirosomataceae bacterium]|jgi:hypothetical protein